MDTQYLGVISVVLCLLVAGCIAPLESSARDPSPPTTITVDSVTVVPGSEATITVEVTNMSELYFPAESLDAVGAIALSYDQANLSPPPDAGADSYPPIWFWYSPQPTVTVTIPVHVSETTEPGAYSYSVTVRSTTEQGAEGVTEEFVVRVVNRTRNISS